MTTSGTTPLTFTPTCPSGNGGGANDYTATSTSFTLYNAQQGGGVRLEVLNKR